MSEYVPEVGDEVEFSSEIKGVQLEGKIRGRHEGKFIVDNNPDGFDYLREASQLTLISRGTETRETGVDDPSIGHLPETQKKFEIGNKIYWKNPDASDSKEHPGIILDIVWEPDKKANIVWEFDKRANIKFCDGIGAGWVLLADLTKEPRVVNGTQAKDATRAEMELCDDDALMYWTEQRGYFCDHSCVGIARTILMERMTKARLEMETAQREAETRRRIARYGPGCIKPGWR